MAGKNGGVRPGAGRPKGAVNKITEEARIAAMRWAPRGFDELARIAGLTRKKGSDSDAARVQAISLIHDRAYGKAKQPVEGEMLVGVSEELRRFIAGNTTAARAFLGFDGEDQDPQAETHNGALPDHR